MPDESRKATREERLGELLARFHARRADDASIGIGVMREEAGELFDDLVGFAETETLIRKALEDSTDEELPEWFGPYEVLEQIGRGGMGTVYRARDSRTGDEVALKVLREAIGASEKTLERFRREGAAAAGIDHPHVVRVLDTGEHDGRLFIAMELVEGGDLADLLNEMRENCPPTPGPSWLKALDTHGIPAAAVRSGEPAVEYARRISALFAPVADALAMTKEAGIVHRDIKPRNLLLTEDGRLLLSDFGLAKVVGTDLTSSALILGTPLYLSPEQARGASKSVDARSDIYALGSTLYETLALRPPVVADTYAEVISAILRWTPSSLRSLIPAYPAGLAAVVARCQEKLPEDRYQEPAELAADLRRAAGGERTAARPVSPLKKIARSLRRHPRLVAGVAAAALLLVAAILFWPEPAAELDIEAHPVGELFLNGTSAGETPYHGEIDGGIHRLRVELARFRPHEEEIVLEPGEKARLTVNLVPEDPFDPQALQAVARAHGIELGLPISDPPRSRGVGSGAGFADRVTLVGPRGKVTAAGLRLVLDPGDFEGPVVVEILDGDERVYTGSADGAELPPLQVEREYRLRVGSPGESDAVESRFTVVPPPRPSELPGAAVVRIRYLAERGLLVDAYSAARDLADAHPDRALPVRLMLDTLERLGLAGSPLFHTLRLRWEKLRAF